MRNGVLLAEDTPINIMIKFECNSIEDAFLILSQKQGDSDIVQPNTINTSQPPAIMHSVEVIDATLPEPNDMCKKPPLVDENYNKTQPTDQGGHCCEQETENRKRIFFTTRGRIKALMTKNFVQLFRQPS